MSCRPKQLLLTEIVAAVVSISFVNAQVPQSNGSNIDQDVYTISDHVDLVLLDASVKEPGGGYVTGLHRSNFRVYEDGNLRQITQFSSVDAPVTIGLVVDNSGSMRSKRPYVVMAGLSFEKQSNPRDEFFVVNFNNYIQCGLPPQTPFTDKLSQLRMALYYGAPEGQTALYDAVAYAIKHLELGHREKRTLVVVSDGRDNVSKLSFPNLVQIIEASRATIYTIGVYDKDDLDANPDVLRKMAHISGGEFFAPQKLDDVLPIFNQISADIRNRYTIGYTPDEVNDKRTIRTVKLTATMDGQKLRVRTRTSYTTAPLSRLLAEIPRAESPQAR